MRAFVLILISINFMLTIQAQPAISQRITLLQTHLDIALGQPGDTVSIETFDRQGRLLQMERWEMWRKTFEAKNLGHFQFDESGRHTGTWYQNKWDEKRPYYFESFRYDVQGRLSEKGRGNPQFDSIFQPKFRYHYSGKRLIQKELLDEYGNLFYEYNKRGELRNIVLKGPDSEPRIIQKIDYLDSCNCWRRYNEKVDLGPVGTTYYKDREMEKPFEFRAGLYGYRDIQRFYYGTNDRLLQKKTFGQKNAVIQTDTFSYDEFGNLISSLILKWQYREMESKQLLFRDSLGRVVERQSIAETGFPEERIVKQYGQNGNLKFEKKQTFLRWEHEEFYYSYQGKTAWRIHIRRNWRDTLLGGPTVDTLGKYSLIYDENDSLKKVLSWYPTSFKSIDSVTHYAPYFTIGYTFDRKGDTLIKKTYYDDPSKGKLASTEIFCGSKKIQEINPDELGFISDYFYGKEGRLKRIHSYPKPGVKFDINEKNILFEYDMLGKPKTKEEFKGGELLNITRFASPKPGVTISTLTEFPPQKSRTVYKIEYFED